MQRKKAKKVAKPSLKLYDLEKEFSKVYLEQTPKILKLIKEAETALEKAAKISEEYGIPIAHVRAGLFHDTSTTYVPHSFTEKFFPRIWSSRKVKTTPILPAKEMKEFFEFMSNDLEIGLERGTKTNFGWQHSAYNEC